MGARYCQDCVGLGATGAVASGMTHLSGMECRTDAIWPACTGSRSPMRPLCNVPGEQGTLNRTLCSSYPGRRAVMGLDGVREKNK